MSLLRESLQAHADRLIESAAELVTYIRGDGTQLSNIEATLGVSIFEQIGSDGFATQIHTQDFIVRRADLCVAGVKFLPQRNDRIAMVLGDLTQDFRVLPDTGISHYRPADAYGVSLRIFTKRI